MALKEQWHFIDFSKADNKDVQINRCSRRVVTAGKSRCSRRNPQMAFLAEREIGFCRFPAKVTQAHHGELMSNIANDPFLHHLEVIFSCFTKNIVP